MKQPERKLYGLPLCLLLILPAFELLSKAASQFDDDFHTGTDTGWTHLEPLAPFGAAGNFTFPNGGYRIQAATSPNPGSLGSARAGSLRLDQATDNFGVTCDLVNWDNSLNQSIGLLGRVSAPGFGTTRGYAFTYSTAGSITIARLDGEQSTTLASMPLSLDPSKSYELGFQGIRNNLAGVVFDPSVNHDIAVLPVDDITYGQGAMGLYVFSNVGNGTSDATFDNFHDITNVPEPSTWSLMMLGAAGMLYAALRCRKQKTIL